METSRQKRFGREVAGLLAQWQRARRKVIDRTAGRAAVHQWRVSSRRLQALGELLAPADGRRGRDDLHKYLHAAFHAAGRLRDAQLAIAPLQELSPRYPAAGRMIRHLRRWIPRQRHRVARHVRRVKPRVIRGILGTWGILDHPGMARLTARAALRLRHARQQQAQAGCRTGRELHRRRVHLKALHYMQDFSHAAGLRIPSEPATPHLERMQRMLSDIADLRALIGVLDRFAAKHPAWKLESAELRRHLHRQQLGLAAITYGQCRQSR